MPDWEDDANENRGKKVAGDAEGGEEAEGLELYAADDDLTDEEGDE